MVVHSILSLFMFIPPRQTTAMKRLKFYIKALRKQWKTCKNTINIRRGDFNAKEDGVRVENDMVYPYKLTNVTSNSVKNIR